MNGLFSFLEKHFVPVAAKFGAQRHMVAIRDAFVALMPLMIAGSFAVLINALPVPAYQDFMTGLFPDWKAFGGAVWTGSFGIMGLLIAFSLAYNLARSYDENGLFAGILSVACFVALMPEFSMGYTGTLGLFVALFSGIVSSEVFVRLSKSDKLVLKMPEGVPPAVSKSFAALFPGMATIAVFSLFSVLLRFGFQTDLFALVTKFVSAPITNVADSFGSAFVVVFMNQLLWFFGLHGSNIIGGIIEPVFLPMIEANMAAFQAGQAVPYIMNKQFLDVFVYIGGSGATLPLIVALFLVAKQKSNKEIAKLGLAPGFFNINETVLFGMPLVLNPVMFIPFLFGPVLVALFSYAMIASGLFPRVVAIVPWTTPPIIGGFLATGSIMGSVLQAINFVLYIVIYAPFVMMSERVNAAKEETKKAA